MAAYGFAIQINLYIAVDVIARDHVKNFHYYYYY